jgi:hypothetical protein
MLRLLCTFLLSAAAAFAASAQSLSDAARAAEVQRKTLDAPEKKYTASSLPGPARIDAILGDFLMTDAVSSNSREVEIDLIKARRLDLNLDRYLLKWEFATRGDPFGMAEPMQREAKVIRLFNRRNLAVQDYLFFRAALERAKVDRQELKAARATLPAPRVANVEFLEKHENLLQPRWDFQSAYDDLERDRKFRARE